MNIGITEFWFRLWSVWNTSGFLHCLFQNWLLVPSPPRHVLSFAAFTKPELKTCGRVQGWRAAVARTESGKPDRELHPPSQTEHRGRRIMVGLSDLKGLEQHPTHCYDFVFLWLQRWSWLRLNVGVNLSQALDLTAPPVLGDGSLEQITHPTPAIGSITPWVEHKDSNSGSFVCRAGMSPFRSWSHPATINTSCTHLHCPSLAAGNAMLYSKGNSFVLETSFPLSQCLCAQISRAWCCSSPPPG